MAVMPSVRARYGISGGAVSDGQNPNLPAPLPNYGTDVNLGLPNAKALALEGVTVTNSNYKGCLTSPQTA